MKTTFIISAILGLLAGIVWGRHTAMEGSQAMESGTATSALNVTWTFSARQFAHADHDHAKSAILEEVYVLQLLERITPNLAYRVALSDGYARLAMIEEYSNDRDAAHRAFEQARIWFGKDHPGQELTDDQMRQGVQRIDNVLDRR